MNNIYSYKNTTFTRCQDLDAMRTKVDDAAGFYFDPTKRGLTPDGTSSFGSISIVAAIQTLFTLGIRRDLI